jgi:hypothetical protein
MFTIFHDTTRELSHLLVDEPLRRTGAIDASNPISLAKTVDEPEPATMNDNCFQDGCHNMRKEE